MFGKSENNRKIKSDSNEKVKLSKLNKTELLWIIRDQQVEIEELKGELEKLRSENSGSSVQEHTEDKADEQSTASNS
ncbi:MAG: hypothetical protein ACI4RC_07025 [Oscillospiraceae bacterium]